MDTATLEAAVSVMDTEQIDEIQNNEKCDEIKQSDSPATPDTDALQENTQHQQRQDFTSEMFKIELTNMGKFSFGVCNSFFFINFEYHSSIVPLVFSSLGVS